MKKIIAIPATLVLLGLAACGTAAPAAQAPVAAPAMTTAAPVETPATTVAPIPPPAPAPVETVAPTTAAPAPAPAPVEVEVNIQNDGTDVVVPEGPVVMAPAPAPQVIVIPPPPPVYVAPPAPVYVDESLIAPGTIEDGVHYGYLTSAGRMWSSFTFDRADLAQDGTWSNTNSKLRTMPIVEGAPTPYFEPGLPIEVHVQNQHVVAIYEAYPIYPMVALDDGLGGLHLLNHAG